MESELKMDRMRRMHAIRIAAVIIGAITTPLGVGAVTLSAMQGHYVFSLTMGITVVVALIGVAVIYRHRPRALPPHGGA